MTIARRYLYETADAIRLDALVDGIVGAAGRAVGKIVREERYHRMHVEIVAGRASLRPMASRAVRLLAAFETLAPDAATVFTPLPGEPALVDAGILAVPMVELQVRWRGVDRAHVHGPRP